MTDMWPSVAPPPALHGHHEPLALWTAASGVWIVRKLNGVATVLLYSLRNPHFFGELNQMTQLASSDTFLNNVVMYSGAVLLAGSSLTGILYSYSKIVSSIYGISLAQGKYKAFSPCASHLSAILIFIAQA